MTASRDGEDIDIIPRETVLEHQRSSLEHLLTHIAKRSPFYKHRLEGVDTWDPRTLPTTTREDLMASQIDRPPWGGTLAVDVARCSLLGFSNAIAAGLPGHQVLQLAATAEDMRGRTATAARGLSRGGSGPDDRTAILGEVARSLLHHEFLGGLARCGSTPFQTGRGLTLRHVRHTLPALAPTQLVTHPTYALHLSRLLSDEGKELPVERLFLWGETGPSVPPVRATLEEAWGHARVRDVYAVEELGVLAVECREGNGLHGFEDRFVYEVMDVGEDRVLGPGALGELVVTTLHAEAMPMLRYRTGDLVMVDDGPCACGGTHLRLHVMGRVVRVPGRPATVIDLAKVEGLLGRLKGITGLYRVVVEEDRAMLEVPLAALDENQQAVAINTALMAARSTGTELRPVKELPEFIHRAWRVVRLEDLEWWDSLATEQRRLEE